jgi:nitroimidazol reductase NimA-like FMN-containing flavoprotein (pyridoxamine 5'-phosphate oxidase superfamily)
MNDFQDLSMQSSVSGGSQPNGLEQIAIQDYIRRLIDSQSYAVLCTQGQSQPYGSLVAFAASDDLKNIIFSTPIATRKYRLLSECENVALVVDSRSISAQDLMKIEAVTAIGRARIVKRGPDFDRWSNLLINRHPHMADFVHAESSALVRIEIARYFHVGSFQEVQQWVPGNVVNP